MLILSFFPLIKSHAETQDIEHTITFQPNVIPLVDVHYENFSFVFEYKSYFIRIKPFIIHDGQYYGMQQIVTWIKNNYPNINYTWLVDKAERAIHYGFNLTKLPQEVADKIDYLGFRLVDYNFPLSYFELEIMERRGETYNVTLIKIPKINLVLSFEDLYPYGYSIEHLNSTYVLIGNVKGRTDLYLDPITYSDPIITVTGGTEPNPITFWDVWNASNVNGWDVVHNNNESNVQYQMDCTLHIGDGSTETWFKDRSVQVLWFSETVVYDALIVYSNAHFILGDVINADAKATQNSSSIMLHDFWNIYCDGGEMSFYDVTIHSLDPAPDWTWICYDVSTIRSRIWNCRFNKVYDVSFYSGSNVSLSNVEIIDTEEVHEIWESVDFENVVFRNSNHELFYFDFSGNITIKNLVASNATEETFYIRTNPENIYLVNPDVDSWTFEFYYSTAKLYRQYTLDLTIFFQNGSYAEVSNVTISNAYLDISDSWLTFINGSIPQQTYSMGHYNQTGGDTIYDYNPYKLTVTLDGYETYMDFINITQKEDLRITLTPSITQDTGGRAGGGFEVREPIPFIFSIPYATFLLWSQGDLSFGGIIGTAIIVLIVYSIYRKLHPKKRRKLRIKRVEVNP